MVGAHDLRRRGAQVLPGSRRGGAAQRLHLSDVRAAQLVNAGGGDVDGRLPGASCRTHRALQDRTAGRGTEAIDAPDRDGVALRIDGNARDDRVLAGGGEIDRRLPRPSRREHRALHHGGRPGGAAPDRDRVAARIDSDVCDRCALTGSREGDGRLPGSSRRTHRALHHRGGPGGVIPDSDRVALGVDSNLREHLKRPLRAGGAGSGDVDGRLPRPAGRPRGTLYDEAARAGVLPDHDGVAVCVDSDLRTEGAVVVRSRQLDRRLPAPAHRTHSALHGDHVPALEALPDRNRAALRINGHLRDERAVAGGGETDGHLPAAARRTYRALHYGVVGVVAAGPDRDRVALRIDGDLRVACVLAGSREIDRRLPGPARRPHRALHDDVVAVVLFPDHDSVTPRIDSDLRGRRLSAVGGEVDGRKPCRRGACGRGRKQAEQQTGERGENGTPNS